MVISILGAKKRKVTMPPTRHTSANNEINPLSNSASEEIEYLSLELPIPEELVLSVSNEIPAKSPNEQITCSIVSDNEDGSDRMPVVASVEEERPIGDSNQSETDTSLVIVESSDCNDEKIQLDDKIPSCSSGYESSAAIPNTEINIYEDDETKNPKIHSRERSSSNSSVLLLNPSTISSKSSIKVNKKSHRDKHGGFRARSRSLTPRHLKKQRLVDDQSSLVTIINSDQIEQHLRTLFVSSQGPRRMRARSTKTSTRLAEEIHINDNSRSMNHIEPHTNVFDILNSSTTIDASDGKESTRDYNQSCTYNVIISDKPNKLGLTIKKIVQS